MASAQELAQEWELALEKEWARALALEWELALEKEWAQALAPG